MTAEPALLATHAAWGVSHPVRRTGLDGWVMFLSITDAIGVLRRFGIRTDAIGLRRGVRTPLGIHYQVVSRQGRAL